jgi:hypothetical protein
VTAYSHQNLIGKLGIKRDMRVIIMHPPKGYNELIPELHELANVIGRLTGRFDFIQYFATSVQQLDAVIPNLAMHLEPGGMLWVSWIKRTSSLNTGLDDAIVRRLGIQTGLVDVKVASINEDWSGLKFVYRLDAR